MFSFKPNEGPSDPRDMIRKSAGQLEALHNLNDNMWSKSYLKKKIPDDRTETKEESLSGSLLKYMDTTKATKADLEEAFCRDIESFNEAFQV